VPPVSENQQKPIDPPAGGWRQWLHTQFPHVTTQPFAERHARLWEWFDALVPGVRPRARVEVWGRGGAKSSTAELATAWVGLKLTRRFVLIVSETQEQADMHVQSISTLFERQGIERAVGKYGSSKGWRRNQLRVANGFNVAALGLDTASRGMKLDEFRPDAIIFDDVDNQGDSAKTIEKKIRSITTAILPAGSVDCAVLFIQNLIRDDGIVGQLVNGEADFLRDRAPSAVVPAVYGLKTEPVQNADGTNVYRIVSGTPSWAGQNLETCERQINDWGLRAFLREAQHEVENADGYVFNVSQFRTCAPADVPELSGICLAFDMAATEGGGDHTAGVLLGKTRSGHFYVLSVIRGQWSADRVQACIRIASEYYKAQYAALKLKLPQDPGQAGKAQAQQMSAALESFAPGIKPETGKKVTRAAGLAEAVNLGNVFLVEQDLPAFLLQHTNGAALVELVDWASWHRSFKRELKDIREDVMDQVDDQMDAAASAFNELAEPVGWAQSREALAYLANR
jgi:predicted phage terminase large subunit-like protein